MGQISWIGPSGGLWINSADWLGGVVPGLGDDAAVAGALVMVGPGSAGSLTVTGALRLQGAYQVGVLSVGTGSAAGALTLSGGASVVAGSVNLAGGSVSVDSTSVLEVGSAGTGATGRLTVDSAASLVGTGAVAAGIVDQGVIEAVGGTLSLKGSLSGSGTLSVGAGSVLSLSGGSGAVPIRFDGADGTLVLAALPALVNGTIRLGVPAEGLISGFSVGDVVEYAGAAAVAGVDFQDNGNGTGTLTIEGGGGVLGRLTLAGDFSGLRFVATPHSGFGADIRVVDATVDASESAGTMTPDMDVWTGGDGAWGDTANWADVSSGDTPAVIAPGSNDLVTVIGSSAGPATLVQGRGHSATTTVLGGVAFDGTFELGVVTAGSGPSVGLLSLVAGAVVTASRLTAGVGSVEVVGAGAALAVAGFVSLGGGTSIVADPPTNVLAALGGAAVTVGGVSLMASAGGDSVVVDATSSLEVGAGGDAVLGALTIDAGATLEGQGAVNAATIIDQGTIEAVGGTLSLSGPVQGGGDQVIAAGAQLWPTNGATTAAVRFAGSNGTLDVSAAGTGMLTVQGVVSGFDTTDTIHVAGNSAVTSVVYQPGAGGIGTLTALSNGVSLGSLSLAGGYGNDLFSVTPDISGGSDIKATAIPWTSPDPLFDDAYYLVHNPDVAAAGVDPYQHYLTFGWKEGRDPSALFDTNYYLAQNPDVKAAGVNPLLHFEQYGWTEGREPSLLFSDADYLTVNTDVAAAGVDPLAHYVVFGLTEGRASFLTGGTLPADPLVNTAYFDAQLGATLIPSGTSGAEQAAWSYDNGGWEAGLNPDAWFDTNYYLSHNPDVAAAHVDPLLHYETYGWKEGRNPSAAFSTDKYLAAYSDVRAANIDPLLHYVEFGQNEGRSAFAV